MCSWQQISTILYSVTSSLRISTSRLKNKLSIRGSNTLTNRKVVGTGVEENQESGCEHFIVTLEREVYSMVHLPAGSLYNTTLTPDVGLTFELSATFQL